MTVHFTASKTNIAENIDTLRKIVTAIHGGGHFLALDWLEPTYNYRVKEGKTVEDWTVIYKENLDVITKSDLVIADTSHNSFGVGYQVALAVQQKKPILLLRKATADKDAFATGIEDANVEQKLYNDDNVEEIVTEFLKQNTIPIKDMRFNFFIDRHIYNYLRWASFKTGKTKAEILRELVVKEIDKNQY